MSDKGRNRRAEQKGRRGREYWGPRKPPMQDPGKQNKRLTHIRERAERKRLEAKLRIFGPDAVEAPKQEPM